VPGDELVIPGDNLKPDPQPGQILDGLLHARFRRVEKEQETSKDKVALGFARIWAVLMGDGSAGYSQDA
jgi:hypothetical protein